MSATTNDEQLDAHSVGTFGRNYGFCRGTVILHSDVGVWLRTLPTLPTVGAK